MSPVPATRATIRPLAIPERRACVRHRAPICGDLILNGGRESLPVAILNIGEQGALIQTSTPKPLPLHAELTLIVAGLDDSLYATGLVAWSDNSSRAGIRFSTLHCGATGSLDQWLQHNFRDALNSLPRQIPGANQISSEPTPIVIPMLQAPLETVGPSLQPITDGALRLTHSTGAAIAWARGEEMICIATAGSSAPPVGARLQVGSGFSGECIRTAKTLRCDDSELDDRVNRESCRGLGIRSMLAVPILSGNQVYGLLEVFGPDPNHFSSQHQHILEKFAEIIASPATDTSRTIVTTKNTGTVITAEQWTADRTPASPVVRMVIKGKPKAVAASIAAILPGLKHHAPSACLKSERSRKAILAIAALGVAAILLLSWFWMQSARGRLQASVSQSQSRGSGLNADSDASSVLFNATDLTTLRESAEQGDADGQFALAERYAIGKETTQDNAQAALWLTRAAEQGHTRAQSLLSSYYEAGTGVPQDLAKAYFWAAVAATGGDSSSENRIAFLNSSMSRAQVLDAQQQFGLWLRQHSTTR